MPSRPLPLLLTLTGLALARLALAGLALARLALAAPALAASKPEQVRFKAGASAATLSGRVKGEEAIDYMLRANAGQSMSVRLVPDNASCHFDLYPPGAGKQAMHVGASAGDAFSGTLPATGTYRTQVHLDRDAARRREACSFSITFAIAAPAAPDATKSTRPAPGKDEQACLEGVSREANSTAVMVLGSTPSPSGSTVTVGVGEDRAPWTCVVEDGQVAAISSPGTPGSP